MANVFEKQVFASSIGTLEIGTGEQRLVIGGGNTWPLYAFDGEPDAAAATPGTAPATAAAPAPGTDAAAAAPAAAATAAAAATQKSTSLLCSAAPPRVGLQISDLGSEGLDAAVASFYADCADVPAMAVKAAAVPGVEFIALAFDGANPAGANKAVEECVALAQAVAQVCPLPLVVAGSGNSEKDSALFEKIAEALEGENVLFVSAKEENYKAVGAAVALAWNQKLAAESAVDINLAKQLNLLLGQLGVKNESLAMNVGCAVAGYGFEYVVSTMERVKSTALTQADASLQMPIITPVGADAWNVKESLAEEADYPQWGPREERGIQMEVVTAAACLAAGSDAVILLHPTAATTIATLVELLIIGGSPGKSDLPGFNLKGGE
ncbi:MAG: acetyl-CoA decarbonylase/synthase complex subunit delta [Coriobacteriales bacterium]|jgi:acetyl-CoA decarbonylase/synthase complex subunit delta|nr:acetyl-CoA decarbonylase/synthase complex subunit delta [Coriobacteriales bacterium]